MAARKKHRFPPIRIKKILQADEDVGRVSQSAPPVISVAIEQFLKTLMGAAADQMGDGVTTLAPTHLKRCIEADPKFDYLKEIVAAVQETAEADKPDAEKAAKKRKRATGPRAPRKAPKKEPKAEPEEAAAAAATPKEEPLDDPVDEGDAAMFGLDADAGEPAADDNAFAGLSAPAASADGDDDDDYD